MGESWHSIGVKGPEKGRVRFGGGRMIQNFKNGAGREYWVCGTEPGHQERRVGEDLHGLSGLCQDSPMFLDGPVLEVLGIKV
jgi:hypothetical protein